MSWLFRMMVDDVIMEPIYGMFPHDAEQRALNLATSSPKEHYGLSWNSQHGLGAPLHLGSLNGFAPV